MNQEERNALISDYFRLGLQQPEILALLVTKHDIVISERQLKRILLQMGLRRRSNYSPLQTVTDFLKGELGTSSQLHGYKWMHLKCIQAGLVVKRETVRLLLKELDPMGVEMRLRGRLRRRIYHNRGPNFLWHLDAYDKLKPYGICIHGCIDGFSRHVMWLKAGTTSSDPRVVAGYFIAIVESEMGCPVRIRSDFGTENSAMQQMQIILRKKENDVPESAWLYGTSPHNQRIEAWWAILRKHQAQFWMSLFLDLKEGGLFAGTFLDKSLVQYCFMKIIQDELDRVVVEWNCHRISRSRNAVAPAGKPIMMYYSPHMYGAKDYKRELDIERLVACKEECIFQDLPCDKDVFELCNIIVEEKGLVLGKDPYNAVDIYIALRAEFQSLID